MQSMKSLSSIGLTASFLGPDGVAVGTGAL